MLYILFDVAFSISLFPIILRISRRFRKIHGALFVNASYVHSPSIYRHIQNYIRQKSTVICEVKLSWKIAMELGDYIIDVHMYMKILIS